MTTTSYSSATLPVGSIVRFQLIDADAMRAYALHRLQDLLAFTFMGTPRLRLHVELKHRSSGSLSHEAAIHQ